MTSKQIKMSDIAMKYLEAAWSSCIDIKADGGVKSHETAVVLFLFEADS